MCSGLTIMEDARDTFKLVLVVEVCQRKRFIKARNRKLLLSLAPPAQPKAEPYTKSCMCTLSTDSLTYVARPFFSVFIHGGGKTTTNKKIIV